MLGLAPGGVCLASDIAATAGGLLHHRFTLTCRMSGRQYTSLLHLPSGYPARLLTGTVLYGVRTFLSPTVAEPRPPGQLDTMIVTSKGVIRQGSLACKVCARPSNADFPALRKLVCLRQLLQHAAGQHGRHLGAVGRIATEIAGVPVGMAGRI
jgi:hypothetical protein